MRGRDLLDVFDVLPGELELGCSGSPPDAGRLASGDPRLSLEERYRTHSRYVELVRQALERLVAERLILQEDAEAFIKLAEERGLGLSR